MAADWSKPVNIDFDLQRVQERTRANLESVLSENPEIEKAARRIATELLAGDPDSLIFKGHPEYIQVAGGVYYRAPAGPPFPLWRAFVLTANAALTVVDERASSSGEK